MVNGISMILGIYAVNLLIHTKRINIRKRNAFKAAEGAEEWFLVDRDKFMEIMNYFWTFKVNHYRLMGVGEHTQHSVVLSRGIYSFHVPRGAAKSMPEGKNIAFRPLTLLKDFSCFKSQTCRSLINKGLKHASPVRRRFARPLQANRTLKSRGFRFC
jgi:hypothetical protein